jgi:hypothetical protein
MAPKYPYIARGGQKYQVSTTKVYNIDNGSGTTDDFIVFANLPKDVQLISVQAVYTQATDTTGAASANFKLGVAVGGDTIVAATALTALKAVGAVTSATIAIDRVAAGATLFCRHTGVATTEVGEYYVQVVYQFAP